MIKKHCIAAGFRLFSPRRTVSDYRSSAKSQEIRRNSSAVEHLVYTEAVGGSNPSSCTIPPIHLGLGLFYVCEVGLCLRTLDGGRLFSGGFVLFLSRKFDVVWNFEGFDAGVVAFDEFDFRFRDVQRIGQEGGKRFIGFAIDGRGLDTDAQHRTDHGGVFPACDFVLFGVRGGFNTEDHDGMDDGKKECEGGVHHWPGRLYWLLPCDE